MFIKLGKISWVIQMKNKLNIFTLLILLILISISVYAYHSPELKIKTIKLRGVNTFDENLIISFAEDYIDKNIIYLKRDRIEDKLIDAKYIKNASFKRIFPDTALFTIEESDLIFRFVKDDIYFYIDKQGNLYSQDELKQKILLPILKGYDVNDSLKKVNFSLDMEIFINVLEKYMQENSIKPQYIVFDNQKLTLKFNNKYDIVLGDLKNMSDKFRVMKNITQKIEQKNYSVKYIDISVYNKPVLKLKQ